MSNPKIRILTFHLKILHFGLNEFIRITEHEILERSKFLNLKLISFKFLNLKLISFKNKAFSGYHYVVLLYVQVFEVCKTRGKVYRNVHNTIYKGIMRDSAIII